MNNVFKKRQVIHLRVRTKLCHTLRAHQLEIEKKGLALDHC